MACDILDEPKMPYLRAIQAIPGDTASEKMKWIGKAAWAIGYPEQLPDALKPLMKVEVALRQKKHEDIADCLISEDAMVINRALKANWFFDHSNIRIGIDCFVERIFPYVSVNTRKRIINKLADNLTDSAIAEVLFEELEPDYDIYNICPLMAACDDQFVFETIDTWKLALPVKVARKLFRKNPDLVIRYFKLLKPAKPNERVAFSIDMHQYAFLLPKLVKNRVHDFAELFEMYEDSPLRITLSNTCAEIFLKKGLQYLIKKPHLYINILPLKKISADILESIFLGLLPKKIFNFDTNKMLKYLEYYPLSKRYELLRTSYLKKYDTELLNDNKNVTPALLRILPEKERVEQARIKLELESLKKYNSYDLYNYDTAWVCYLPIDEAISSIKKDLNTTTSIEKRVALILQMIYACKVNEKIKDDNDAPVNEKDASGDDKNASTNEKDPLAETLKYFIERYKNDNSLIYNQIMRQLLNLYDVPHLNKECHELLFDIIKLCYVKCDYIMDIIAEAVIHYRLINNMPIDELILMMIKSNDSPNFNLLERYPQYERKCLVTFAKIIEEEYSVNLKTKKYNSTRRISLTCSNFVIAMYNFNDRCQKSRTKIERLTIKDYPWLLDSIRDIIQLKAVANYVIDDMLKIKELELMLGLKRPADVTTGAALALLKQNPQDIMDNWNYYLKECKKNHKNKIAQRFVRATRWYKDIPIRFVKSCMDYLKDEKHRGEEEMLSTLTILALLLDGETLTNLLLPFIPKKSTIDADDPKASQKYKIVRHLPLCMRISNPPVSMVLIYKLCEGDYLSIALRALMNLGRRYQLDNAMTLGNKLSKMRVSTRKHGIRLMYELCGGNVLLNFLKTTWYDSTHHSVREVIFKLMQKIMFRTPTKACLKVHKEFMESIGLNNEMLLSQLEFPIRLPDKGVTDYFEVWIKAIGRLQFMGLDSEKVNKHLIAMLQAMTPPYVCNLISEALVIQIIENYLFNIDDDLSKATRRFSMSYLFVRDEIKMKERGKMLINTIGPLMTAKWDECHDKKSRFFPYNNSVHQFIKDFVVSYVDQFYFVNKFIGTQLIDSMLESFLSMLKPTQAPTSYLLLTYTKMLQESTLNNKCFGWLLDQHMPELIKIFSTSLVQFMAKVLLSFLHLIFKNYIDLQEFKFSLMENLVKADNKDSWLVAVTILSPVTLKNFVTRYDKLIKKFQEMKDPVISSVLHDYLNTMNFDSIIFD